MALTKEYKCSCIVTTGLANTVIELCPKHQKECNHLIVLGNDQVQWEGIIN